MEEKTGTVGTVLFGSMWEGLDVEGRFGKRALTTYLHMWLHIDIYLYIYLSFG